jgi:hypothetical protein
MRAGQRLPPELKIESVMPLILVGNAQEPAALQQEVTDYHVVSGGLRVGRIYKRKSAMRVSVLGRLRLFLLDLIAGGQAAARVGEQLATFQGRSSAIRLIRWSAMRPSTSRK